MEYFLSSDMSVEFVLPVPNFVLCDWCNGFILEQYLLPCKHKLCCPCFEEIHWVDGSFPCPLEKTSFRKLDVISKVVNREDMEHLQVRCPNRKNGCKQSFPLRDIDVHLKNCAHFIVPCPNLCEQEVKISLLKMHISDECERRFEDCEYCGEPFIHIQIDQHKKICPEKSTSCYFCKESGIKQKALDEHFKTCAKRPRSCKMKTLGCEFQGDSEAVKTHEMSYKEHYGIIYNTMLDCASGKEDIMSIQDKVNSLQSDLSQELGEIKKTQYAVNANQSDLLELAEIIKQENIYLRNENIQLKKKIQILETDAEKMNKEIKTLTQSVEQLKVKYSNIKCQDSNQSTSWEFNNRDDKNEYHASMPYTFEELSYYNQMHYNSPYPMTNPPVDQANPVSQKMKYSCKWSSGEPYS